MQDSKEYSMPSEADTDYTAEMDALDEQFKNGEIDRDQYISRINELYKKAGDEYGTIPKGEEVAGDENFDNPAPQSVEGKKKAAVKRLSLLAEQERFRLGSYGAVAPPKHSRLAHIYSQFFLFCHSLLLAASSTGRARNAPSRAVPGARKYLA